MRNNIALKIKEKHMYKFDDIEKETYKLWESEIFYVFYPTYQRGYDQSVLSTPIKDTIQILK